MTVFLESLPVGARFEVRGIKKQGSILSKTEGGITVKYDGSTTRQIKGTKNGKEVVAEFEAPNRSVVIAPRTEVVKL